MFGFMSERSPMDEKLPVWTAFSELFRDTQLSRNDIARIPMSWLLPYDDAMLEGILIGKVLPVFGASRQSPLLPPI
jgi:hypothetical protein